MTHTLAVVIDGPDTCTNCDGAGWIRDWTYPNPDGESELATCPVCKPIALWEMPTPAQLATEMFAAEIRRYQEAQARKELTI